jgi:hypothetical protein
MVSRENKVIALFVALAFVVLAAVSEFASPASWVGAAVVLVVGVVLPTLVNEYLDSRAS